MSTKQLIAASVFALIGTAAFAGEATEFVDPPCTLSRAAVIAELQQARARGELVGYHEADLRAEHATPSVRSRAEVRAEARMAARGHHDINLMYIGGA